MRSQLRTAVLFLVFRRPDTTAKVFKEIRRARPRRLYIAADGPRLDRPEETILCEEARAIATAVDWPCNVQTLFREENLGCKVAVSSAIDWFFDNENEGIILEDDCVPLSSFFEFCETNIERYREDNRVGMINGSNYVANHFNTESTYVFSSYAHCHGWATWRRTWKLYDVDMENWGSNRERNSWVQPAFVSKKSFKRYWKPLFDATHRGEIDSWDYQLTYLLLNCRKLAIVPRTSLILNIGYGVFGATHTTGGTPGYIRDTVAAEIEIPYTHPDLVSRNTHLDKLEEQYVFCINRKHDIVRQFEGGNFSARVLQVLRRSRIYPLAKKIWEKI